MPANVNIPATPAKYLYQTTANSDSTAINSLYELTNALSYGTMADSL